MARPQTRSSSPRKRGPSIAERPRLIRGAAAYWVARSSRAMTWVCAARSSSSSLPRRDDLDLVARFQRRLGPAATRQHVVIHGDRKMRALIVEFAQQRVDMAGRDFALLAV